MSNRHLPAGQNIQGGPGGVPGADMGGGPGGPRRRQPPQYVPPYHHQQMHHMYANYMPYGPQQYYGMPPHYQNAGMHSPGYMPYHQNYARSPPSMHQYVPMAGVSVPSNYPRHAQHSPALSTPYQPPPAPAPIPPHTPSSTHSSHMFPPPPTPPTPQTREPVPPPPAIAAPAAVATPPAPTSAPVPAPAPVPVQEPTPEPTHDPVPESVQESVPDTLPVETKAPFRPPLPWLSRPDLEFPRRTVKSRRRRRAIDTGSQAISLPVEQHEAVVEQNEANTTTSPVTSTPKAFVQPAEATRSATPTTPSSLHHSEVDTATTATPTSTGKPSTRAAIPAIPIVPALPKASTAKDGKPSTIEKTDHEETSIEAARHQDTSIKNAEVPTAGVEPGAAEAVSTPPVRAPPTSWANLFSNAAAAGGKAAGSNGATAGGASVNGSGTEGVVGAANGSTPSFSKSNVNSVAEAIHSYRVGGGNKISFLEPRGLINTGNMCYMNSVLQVLMFCAPFYDFLDQVSKRAVHSFKSETPLIDAMIMFMREYRVIKSGASTEQLRRLLKSEELEKYGEPFTPEFVYEAIRQLPRFASMRRGHQQDAEEFLGFLLQSLDDECTAVLGNSLLSSASLDDVPSNGANGGVIDPSGDWLEVGRKQRAAVTRSAGSSSSTPLTRIFGGLLRSEFRVPGLKDSITTEPYQPLQLDIGSPDVRNVIDALRGLTRPERLQGDFNSPRGKDVTATKQVFIETLPPVLILHLKRFQFDAEGNGTIKIWKKVGYPLDLEIPREALSRQKRQTLGETEVPKYKLISVVYHHGKNASGGHYTVDVRRQDGHEWIRLDDTVIRRVRSEDVAEGGQDEDVKDTRKDATSQGPSGNRFGAMIDEDTGDEDGWKQVTASAEGKKRWSNVVNGSSSGSASKAKQVKDSIKDNKVAYLLFYQRV